MTRLDLELVDYALCIDLDLESVIYFVIVITNLNQLLTYSTTTITY